MFSLFSNHGAIMIMVQSTVTKNNLKFSPNFVQGPVTTTGTGLVCRHSAEHDRVLVLVFSKQRKRQKLDRRDKSVQKISKRVVFLEIVAWQNHEASLGEGRMISDVKG